jgi:hypothetical protein
MLGLRSSYTTRTQQKKLKRWIRDSQTANEREEKQAVANIVRLRAQDKMNNLRQFAELILAHERNRKP